LNLRTTYLFDRRFGRRGILRFDSARRRLLTDLRLRRARPRHGGLRGLRVPARAEGWDGSAFLPGQGDYLTTRRGLFLKASYAKRF
jgi:hypothetical protein